jgi:hypothetical protein
VIGADQRLSGPSCVLLKRVPQGRTESGGIVLAANAGPRVPRGGVIRKRRCTYRPSVIYFIVNKLLSLSLSLSLLLLLSFHLKRRCTYRPSVIYLIVNKSLSLSLSLPPLKMATPWLTDAGGRWRIGRSLGRVERVGVQERIAMGL